MELRKQNEYHSFLQLYPQYASTAVIDSIRKAEYPHLNEAHGQISFDYGGVGLFSNRISDRLDFELAYTSSSLATHALYDDEKGLEGLIRRRILTHLRLDQRDYCIVFAADALSALRLLVESYEFSRLLLGYDFENGSLGRIKRSSLESGTKVFHATLRDGFELHEESMRRRFQAGKKKHKQEFKGLFAYPMTSRVTGVENSVEWIKEAQNHGWCVLLDVSGCGACSMDLARLDPDFLVCSFYKVFGMDPTGLGCLVIKKRMLSKLSSRDGASGLVKLVSRKSSFTTAEASGELKDQSSLQQRFIKAANKLQEAEGMKLSYLQRRMLSMVRSTRPQDHTRFSGLDYAEKLRIYIMLRQEALLSWLRSSLAKLRHHSSSGCSELVRIHSPPNSNPTIAFSLLDFEGDLLEPRLVQRLANRSNISLGTGVLRVPSSLSENSSCNLDYKNFNTQSGCLGKRPEASQQKSLQLPVLCATVGFLSSFSDGFRLLEFVEQFLDSDFCSRELLKYQGLNQVTIIL